MPKLATWIGSMGGPGLRAECCKTGKIFAVCRLSSLWKPSTWLWIRVLNAFFYFCCGQHVCTCWHEWVYGLSVNTQGGREAHLINRIIQRPAHQGKHIVTGKLLFTGLPKLPFRIYKQSEFLFFHCSPWARSSCLGAASFFRPAWSRSSQTVWLPCEITVFPL